MIGKNYNKKILINSYFKQLLAPQLFFLNQICLKNTRIIKWKILWTKKSKNSIFFKKLLQNSEKTYTVDRLRKNSFDLTRRFLTFFFKKKITGLFTNKNRQYKAINIKVKKNNIFCTYRLIEGNSINFSLSAGKVGIKVSRKNLKYTYYNILSFFFKKLKKKRKNYNNTVFNIIAPKRIRTKIFKFVKKQISLKRSKKIKKSNLTIGTPKAIKHRQNITIYINPKKCFNGCRGKKQIKKKRKYNQIFK